MSGVAMLGVSRKCLPYISHGRISLLVKEAERSLGRPVSVANENCLAGTGRIEWYCDSVACLLWSEFRADFVAIYTCIVNKHAKTKW